MVTGLNLLRLGEHGNKFLKSREFGTMIYDLFKEEPVP